MDNQYQLWKYLNEGKRIDGYRGFLKICGVLHHIDLFHDIAIQPDLLLGHFLYHRLNEILSFCRSHPEFHIMSLIPKKGYWVNCYWPGCVFYQFGDGDPNPRLYYRLDKRPKDLQKIIHGLRQGEET